MNNQKLPKYKSHKTVYALKIKDIQFKGGDFGESQGATIIPEEVGYVPFDVDEEYVKKHKPKVGGYYVSYADGYASYSPAGPFEDGNKLITGTGMTFGEAMELVKQGKLICRHGWNGKGMFVFMRPADELNIDFLIEKVKSLPQAVKDYFQLQKKQAADLGGSHAPIKFTQYLCMKASDGTIVNGWLASQTDMTAEDWGELVVVLPK